MFKNYTEVVRIPVARTSKKSTALPTCLKAYKCEFCDQGWQSETEVYLHKKEHIKTLRKNEENHFCWTCIRKFDTLPDLIEHFKVCHLLSSEDAKRVEYQIYVCDYCKAIFFNKKLLALHIGLENKLNCLVECPKCPKNINIKYTWGHFQHHDMTGLYACPICYIKCADWNDLRSHLKEHQPCLYCDICGNNYDKISTFNQHYEQHKSLPNKNITAGNDVEETSLPDNNITAGNDVEETELYDKYFVSSCSIKTNCPTKLPQRGLKLPKEIEICVFCREICTTYEEKRQHVLNHQRFKPKQQMQEEKLTFQCCCGQIFYNKVLLKHHLFKNKDSEIVHCSYK